MPVTKESFIKNSLAVSLALMMHFLSNAQTAKRLYIANDNHTDYMWTANEAAYDSAFVHMLDYYLRQIDSTKKNVPDYQARFNCDGSYWLKAYESYRSTAQFQHLIAAIKSGHISSPLNLLVSCYGAQPTEAIIRGMYYAGALERKYKMRFSMAGSMENNTLPLGLASVWAGAGAKYCWKGIGGYGSQMSYAMRAKRKYQLYNYKGLDGTGIIMKWNAYNESKTASLGGYAECRLAVHSTSSEKEIGRIINILDSICDTRSPGSTYPFAVAGAFGWGWDDLETYISSSFINAAKNNTTAARKVRVSNEEDFFKDVQGSYPNLPNQSVSFGNEWDVLCASMNETTARVRRSVEKLRSAEALAAVASLHDKHLMDGLTAIREKAWESLGMYWEHNWTADGPVPIKERAIWQIKLQHQLALYVDTLYDRCNTIIGSQIKRQAPQSFYVFNPLSWTRNDVADILYNGIYPVRVVDKATQKETPSQLVIKDGKQYLRIIAENIPSVGYKVFDITSEKPAAFKQAAIYNQGYLSNPFYRLKLNGAGVITQLYDSLANSRQLADSNSGNYINNLGSNEASDDNVVVENAGPVSVSIKAISTNPVAHTVRVTLFANSPRIDIEDSIQANFGDVKNWGFAFNLKNQTTRHEETGAVLTVKKQSNGGHYADENARYDWQTFNHFADMSEANYGVTLSNADCSFFKLGKSTPDSLWENSTLINALAGGNIDKKKEDGAMLGIHDQDGQKDFLYKFSLAAHQSAFNPTIAMKFALEHQNPLITGMVTGSKNSLSATSFSLLHIYNPDVLLWGIKPSEDGIEEGLITRFWNMGSKALEPSVSFAVPVNKAWQTTHIETNEKAITPQKNALSLSFKQSEIKTYRVILKGL